MVMFVLVIISLVKSVWKEAQAGGNNKDKNNNGSGNNLEDDNKKGGWPWENYVIVIALSLIGLVILVVAAFWVLRD